MFNNKFCLNCGKKAHTSSICIHPKTSYGIINFKLTGDFEKYNDLLKNKYIIKDYNPTVNKINLYWFNNKNIEKDCTELINKIKNSMYFLLISRKNSLGYIEFIRGKYDINNIETLKHLFTQMTDMEINNIIKNDFDYLWNELWKKTAKNKNFEKEYENSLEKFNIMKIKYNEEISNFKPAYPIPEWGFPKGRRNLTEKDINCAIRECHEETSLNISEINLLDRIYPLSEQFNGTNNIEYKNVYYLSIIDNIRNLNVFSTQEDYIEIDNVGWFKYNNIMNLIRPYHIEKKKIINELIKFIAYNILWIDSQNSEII